MKTPGCRCGHTRFAEALAMFREAMKHVNQHDLANDNIIRQAQEQGTSKAYTLPSLATASAQPLAAGWK